MYVCRIAHGLHLGYMARAHRVLGVRMRTVVIPGVSSVVVCKPYSFLRTPCSKQRRNSSHVRLDLAYCEALIVMLKKDCVEWDSANEKYKYFTRHLHVQHLKEVPDEVRQMAWINRPPAPEVHVVP